MGQIVFVHVSDLHIGRKINCHSLEWMPGLRSHHLRLAQALTDAVERLQYKFAMGKRPVVPVVVTGDLTCSGHEDEFLVAHTFLQSAWWLDGHGEQYAGLNTPASSLHTIPGNHDHWMGSRTGVRPRAYNPAIFELHLHPGPWKHTLRSADGDLFLELIGLDSNRGWRSKPGNRNQRARGEIDPEDVAWCDENLGKLGPRTVRCLLSHHGLSGEFEAHAPHPRPDFRQLTDRSKAAVLQLAARHHFEVLLTGHLHRFLVSPVSCASADGGGVHILHELRSATTLQGEPRDHEQGFFLHRLKVDQRDLARWDVYRYDWQQGEFVSRNEPYHQLHVKVVPGDDQEVAVTP